MIGCPCRLCVCIYAFIEAKVRANYTVTHVSKGTRAAGWRANTPCGLPPSLAPGGRVPWRGLPWEPEPQAPQLAQVTGAHGRFAQVDPVHGPLK